MRYIFIILFTIINVLTFINIGLCANAHSSKNNNHLKIKYSVDSINLSTNRLSRQYMGHSISNLYYEIGRRNNIDKNEFETTQDYINRVNKEKSKPILGTLGINDFYALALIPNEKLYKTTIGKKEVIRTEYHNAGVKSNYDADRKILSIGIKNNCTYQGDASGCVETSGAIHEYQSYVASNAMGARVTVRHYDHFMNYLVLFDKQSDQYTIELDNIEIKQAMALKNDIALLIIFKLLEPYRDSLYFKKTPTFSDSKDIKYYYSYLLGIPYELWVYNFKTGFVIKKKTFRSEESNHI